MAPDRALQPKFGATARVGSVLVGGPALRGGPVCHRQVAQCRSLAAFGMGQTGHGA